MPASLERTHILRRTKVQGASLYNNRVISRTIGTDHRLPLEGPSAKLHFSRVTYIAASEQPSHRKLPPGSVAADKAMYLPTPLICGLAECTGHARSAITEHFERERPAKWQRAPVAENFVPFHHGVRNRRQMPVDACFYSATQAETAG